jgi:hypothetical protein
LRLLEQRKQLNRGKPWPSLKLGGIKEDSFW